MVHKANLGGLDGLARGLFDRRMPFIGQQGQALLNGMPTMSLILAARPGCQNLPGRPERFDFKRCKGHGRNAF
jgi:hypothetical protein